MPEKTKGREEAWAHRDIGRQEQFDAMHADFLLRLAQAEWKPWNTAAAVFTAGAFFMAVGAALFALGQHFS
jgi:hypothetical protein